MNTKQTTTWHPLKEKFQTKKISFKQKNHKDKEQSWDMIWELLPSSSIPLCKEILCWIHSYTPNRCINKSLQNVLINSSSYKPTQKVLINFDSHRQTDNIIISGQWNPYIWNRFSLSWVLTRKHSAKYQYRHFGVRSLWDDITCKTGT